MISFEEYTKKRKQKELKGLSFSEYTKALHGSDVPASKTTADIGPVAKSDGKSKERTWFKSSDSNIFGAILGTAGDVVEDAAAGILGMGEGALDAMAMLVPAFAMSQNNGIGLEYDIEQYRRDQAWADAFVKKDLYDEQAIAKSIISAPIKSATGFVIEDASVLGEKSDALAQSAGQLLGTAGLAMTGVPWWMTMGSTSFGSQAETALNEGASSEEAIGSALVSAGAEVLSERLAGIKFGGKTLSDKLLKPFAEKIASKAGQFLVNFGIDAAGEGLEEVFSSVVSNLGTALYKEEKIGELIASEEAMDEYLESFIGGAVLGGASNVVGAVRDKGRAEALTENEKKVVDQEVKNRIADLEKSGKKLTDKEKNQVKKAVALDLEKGYIDIGTIESTLGGETYDEYKRLMEQEDALTKEHEELGQMTSPTLAQTARYQELSQQVKDIRENSKRSQLKEQLGKEVQELAGHDRLGESYREKARRGQAFEADLSKYKAGQQETIKRAVESGLLNNTNRTHEFVDMIARISADKGVLFDFTSNEKLKASGFALEGKTVNGYVKDGSIALNINSGKALNSVVGHEIAHVLEGTDLYKELQQAIKTYATTKGEYDVRRADLEKIYEGVEGADIEAELTADLVGDYLFTDADFVRNLSTEKPNIFKRIYDEIKYLVKVATASSREARELEKVKRVFDKAWKEAGQSQAESNDGIRFSLRNKNITKNTKIPYAINNSYHNVAVNDYKALSTLQGEVKKIARGTYENKATGYKADINSTTINKILNPTKSFYYWDPAHNYIENLNAALNLVELFENAVYVDSKPPQKAKNTGKQIREYHHFVAPIEMNGEDYRVMITAREKTNSNTLYVVKTEVLPNKKRGASVAGQKPTNMIGAPRTISISDLVNGVNIYDYISKQNISYSDGDVKYSLTDSDGRQLSAEQQEYFMDSKVRDENGNLKVMYHGTPNAGFTEFKGGTYFTEHKWYADQYKGQGASSLGYKKTATMPDTYAVYLDIKKPFDTRNQAERDIFYNEYYRQWGMGTDLMESGLPDWMDGEDLREFIEENGYDYDGLILDEGGVGGYGDEVKSRGLSYVVFSPEQVKNIDNTNPTDNPDIRYSISHDNQDIAPIGSYTVHGRDIALDIAGQDIAPIREDMRQQPVSGQQAPVADPGPTDEEWKEAGGWMDGEDASAEQSTPGTQPIKTVKERLAAKLQNYQTELDNNRRLRAESNADYDSEIAKLQEEYASKKRKDTAVANNLLRRIERLQRMKGNIDADYEKRINDLQEKVGKVKDELRTGESQSEQGAMRRELHKGFIDSIKSAFAKVGLDFDEVLKKAKNLSTFATVDNIPQRVMEKTFGYKEGQILADMTVNKVAQNETEGIKWLNTYTDRKKGILKQLSDQYHIKPGSDESAAAQMYAEGFFVGENGEIIEYGDMELAADFPNAKVRENIKGLARDPRIRQIYDETLDAINASRVRNAYPEIPKRKNYFLHFRAMDDTWSRLGIPFNPNDIRAKDLPTDLNGVTEGLKPGQPYFASAMRRTGKKTSFDLLGGLERYLGSAKNQIYHIDDIQTMRALRNYIADTYGQANGLEGLDALTEEEAQERIQMVYSSHLSTFAKFLNEEANILAGKTALIDRGLEGIIGRRGITFLNTLNRQVGANMVGYNISSSLTNILPVVQAFAKTNKQAFVKGFSQTVSNKISSMYGKGDSFAEQSPVMIRRKGADSYHRNLWQKIADPGYMLMGAVDEISTEIITRAKFNELTQKGMDPQKAHYETDKWVSRLMGDRSLGQQPQLFNSKMLGLVTKFQLEVRNQLDAQFYDTIQEAKMDAEALEKGLAKNARIAAKAGSTMVQLFVAQNVFGQAFEAIAGYNPAFDIIEVLLTAIGYDDEEDSEDTALDNIEEAFLMLMEDLPYTSVALDGGRVPISSALPLGQFLKGEDRYGNEVSRWDTIKEAAPYYLLPAGYGQIKKSTAGMKMFDDDLPIAGSYTDSGNLRFSVEDTPANRLQAAVFGQWANENARDYIDNERQTLKKKQIQELTDLDMPIKDYWEYREGLKEQEKLEDKFDYVAGLDLPIEKKNIMINNIVDRKEPVDLSNYDDFSGYEEFDFYVKNTAKYEFLQENGVSYADYIATDDGKKEYDTIFNWAKQNPEKVAVSKVVTDNVIQYRRWASEMNEIRADKDADGDSIPGSAKKKKIAYINGLDLEYGQKLILFRSQYGSDDTYNSEIVDYLNSREELSYEDITEILTELGFDVAADGTVTWK